MAIHHGFSEKIVSAMKPKLEDSGFKDTKSGLYDTKDLNNICSWTKEIEDGSVALVTLSA